MVGLQYVGAAPLAANDIMTRRRVTTAISTTSPSRDSVASQIAGMVYSPSHLTGTYALKTYVDTQDAQFSSEVTGYWQSQDTLNVLTAAVGQPGGVASLEGGLVPLTQIPPLGSGYLAGPWGATTVANGTASNTPLCIATWTIGTTNMVCQPWVFMQCLVTGMMAQPVIEVRIANSATAVPYASTTLVAQGIGRNLYNDYHALAVIPCPTAAGQQPSTALPADYEVWLSAWLYDLNGQSVTIRSSDVISSAAFLIAAV